MIFRKSSVQNQTMSTITATLSYDNADIPMYPCCSPDFDIYDILPTTSRVGDTPFFSANCPHCSTPLQFHAIELLSLTFPKNEVSEEYASIIGNEHVRLIEDNEERLVFEWNAPKSPLCGGGQSPREENTEEPHTPELADVSTDDEDDSDEIHRF